MKITRKERNLIIAVSIGDGHIDKRGSVSMFHSDKQREFVEYKFKLLKRLCTTDKLIVRQSNGTTQYGFRLKVSKFTKMLRRVLYPNGKKHISRKILNRLDAQCLAIWWMDDGSCSNILQETTGNPRTSISTLSTCLSKEENQVIIDWFKEEHGISFGQRKMKNHYALTCRMKEGRKLRDFIGNFVIEPMKYKLSH